MPYRHDIEEHEAAAALADELTAKLGPRFCAKGHRIIEGVVDGVGYVAVCDCDLEDLE